MGGAGKVGQAGAWLADIGEFNKLLAHHAVCVSASAISKCHRGSLAAASQVSQGKGGQKGSRTGHG